MIPSGIEPATFRFVAQYFNHCATANLVIKNIKHVVFYCILPTYFVILCNTTGIYVLKVMLYVI